MKIISKEKDKVIIECTDKDIVCFQTAFDFCLNCRDKCKLLECYFNALQSQLNNLNKWGVPKIIF